MHLDSADAAGRPALLRLCRDARHFRIDPLEAATLVRLQAAVSLSRSVGSGGLGGSRACGLRRQGAAVAGILEITNAEVKAGHAATHLENYPALKLVGLSAAPEHLAGFTETAPNVLRRLGRETMPEALCQSTVMSLQTLRRAAWAEYFALDRVSMFSRQRPYMRSSISRRRGE